MYKILIADDESIERKALRKILSDKIPGMLKIEDAKDGQEALEKAELSRPDLAILDIKMPRLNGLDTARKIKMIYPTCRIVLLSGYTYFNYAKEALSIGINDFLVKPVSDEDLICCIKKLLQSIETQKKLNENYLPDVKKMNNIFCCLEEEFVSTVSLYQKNELYLTNHLDALEIDYIYSISVVLTINDNALILDNEFEVIKEIINNNFSKNRVLIEKIDNVIYGIIFFKQFLQNDQLTKIFDKIISQIFRTIKKDTSIGVGSIKSRPSEIFTSFNEARRSLDSEKKLKIFESSTSKNKVVSTVDLEDELLNAILIVDKDRALAIYSEIFYIIDNNSNNFNDFKITMYEILLVLKRRVQREIAIKSIMFYHINIVDCCNKCEIKTNFVKEIHRIIKMVQSYLDESNISWKKHVISYLEKHFKETITLQEVADIACFSTSYLSRIFKYEFGMNFVSYLNKLRIEEAKKLLSRSNLTIKEIAYNLGYNDSNYFARVFKKETGINASQYKNSTTHDK